jgi:Fur family iron response transcriptional regulator
MAMTALSDMEQSKLSVKLRQAGLRTTQQRLALADLLFSNGNRHVTAEILHGEARSAGLSVSQATIYNTLNQFHEAGLLREVVVEQGRSYFDTNLEDHHHFYVESAHQLIDIARDDISIGRLPEAPAGFESAGVDVIVRLRDK